VVALETARLLEARGGQVGAVILFDVCLPPRERTFKDFLLDQLHSMRSLHRMYPAFIATFRNHMFLLVNLGQKNRSRGLQRLVPGFVNDWFRKTLARRADVRETLEQDHGLQAIREGTAYEYFSIAFANANALKRYEVRPYDGPVIAFRASVQTSRKRETELAVRLGAGERENVHAVLVPGNHVTILREDAGLEVLREEILARIETGFREKPDVASAKIREHTAGKA
jgi:thioesterase domain-containing protein